MKCICVCGENGNSDFEHLYAVRIARFVCFFSSRLYKIGEFGYKFYRYNFLTHLHVVIYIRDSIRIALKCRRSSKHRSKRGVGTVLLRPPYKPKTNGEMLPRNGGFSHSLRHTSPCERTENEAEKQIREKINYD